MPFERRSPDRVGHSPSGQLAYVEELIRLLVGIVGTDASVGIGAIRVSIWSIVDSLQ